MTPAMIRSVCLALSVLMCWRTSAGTDSMISIAKSFTKYVETGA